MRSFWEPDKLPYWLSCLMALYRDQARELGALPRVVKKKREALFADGQVGVYIIFNLCQGL